MSLIAFVVNCALFSKFGIEENCVLRLTRPAVCMPLLNESSCIDAVWQGNTDSIKSVLEKKPLGTYICSDADVCFGIASWFLLLEHTVGLVFW